MAPELLNSIDANELRELAQRVRDYQDAKKLSDNALFRKFAGIGSTKTYKKILDDKLDELDLEKQLTNYRSVVSMIEAIGDKFEGEESLIENMTGPLELKRAYLEASTQESIARLIIVEGDTGSGKTKTGKALITKYSASTVWIEANETWGDSPHALLGVLLKAFGMKDVPTLQSERMEKALERLKETKWAVVIDEGHHLGPRCLNTIKTLINQTPAIFIVLALDTLWKRLERTAYEECRQLTGNRLFERIRLDLRESDISKMMAERVGGLDAAETKKALAIFMQHAPRRGNLAFVRNVMRKLREAADGDDITLETFTAVVQDVINRRGEKS